ncbi:DNA primase [Microbacterium phage Magritte]|nr:DNA primase [Microbacterium phage Magritte]
MTTESPVKLAKELMTISEACIEVGMGDVSNLAKTYCPFGQVFHTDGGRSRAFKVYTETNTAYCFACQKVYDPVSLIATDRDITYRAAAELILEMKAYVSPDYQTRWDALTQETVEVDTEALQDALKIACSRMVPDWATRQFEDRIATKLAQCLGLARKVKNDEDGRKWLDMTKQAMRQALGVAAPSPTS